MSRRSFGGIAMAMAAASMFGANFPPPPGSRHVPKPKPVNAAKKAARKRQKRARAITRKSP